MILKHHLITSAAVIAFATCLVNSSSADGPESYSITELGVVPGKKTSTAAAINAVGQVTGTSSAGPDTETAYRYNGPDSGELEDLGNNLFGSVSRAFAINADGRVVGDSTFYPEDSGAGTIRRAAMFHKGELADLGTLEGAGPFSSATGINASNDVVGFAGPTADSTSTRAFFWSAATGMLDLGTLGGAYSKALAINDSGVVTGYSAIYGKAGNANRAFIYAVRSSAAPMPEEMRDLGTLGGTDSYGTAINASNHVTGYSTVDKEGRSHAFLYDGAKMIDLGSLNPDSSKSDQSFALAMNDQDHVVGYSFLPDFTDSPAAAVFGSPTQAAFVSINGVMTNLNDLIGKEAARYHLYSASGINHKGQIIASAFDYDTGSFVAVLLTPNSVIQRPAVARR